MSKKSFVYIPANVQNIKNAYSCHNNSCQSAYNLDNVCAIIMTIFFMTIYSA